MEKDLWNERRIKVSGKWARTPIKCTLYGIQHGCMGACCKGNFYPAKASGGTCYYLSPTGCILPLHHRPVKCLLYPFVIKDNSLVLYGRALIHTCKLNRKGKRTILQHMKPQLIELFGIDQWKRLWCDVIKQNKDSYLIIPDEIQRDINNEKGAEALNIIPQERNR